MEYMEQKMDDHMQASENEREEIVAKLESLGYPKIKTNYDHPPIPDRSMDWSAWPDGEEELGIAGHGNTEREALLDLIEWLECTEGK